MKTFKLKYVLPAITLLIGLAAVAMPAPSPAQAAAVEKVTICHARSRDNDNGQGGGPYVQNEPNKTADAGGHDGHTGPIAYSTEYAQELKDAKLDWGDIIPPFDYPAKGQEPAGSYPGLNWTTLGQAMWKNDCEFVTAVVPAAVTFVNPTCEALVGSYTIPMTANVVYEISDVAVAAGTYSAVTGSTVSVKAEVTDTDYYFADGTISTWSNTFTAPTNCPGTLGSSTTKTTSTPAVAAATTTQVTSTPTGSVDTGSANNGILALAGFVFSAGLVGASALLKQRVF